MTKMTILITTLAIILLIVGLIGCFIPGIPGPPLSYLALLLANLFIDKIEISQRTLIILGILTALTLVIDFILPILGAKIYGVSKQGTWGSIIGLLIGLIFFPPFGFITGIFLGAIIGELIAGKSDSEALRAGLVSFIGSILSMIYKFSLSVYMLIYLGWKLIV